MKTPDIPQECGLLPPDETLPYIHDGGDRFTGVCFDMRRKRGRAALAAYCMAVIDGLIHGVRAEIANVHIASIDSVFWQNVWHALAIWRAEWSRYGGFTQ